MPGTKIVKLSMLVVLANLLLAGCAARPELQPKSAVVPAGVDFSGQWLLRADPDSRPKAPQRGEPGIRLPPKVVSRRQAQQSRGRSRGSGTTAAIVFLENGESLKITQTESGLFISFDRAIVEEYRFGENRRVSVGPIEAQRVSGWQAERFVVETLDDAGAILAESWALAPDGDTLIRTISLSKGDEAVFSDEQRFDRG